MQVKADTTPAASSFFTRARTKLGLSWGKGKGKGRGRGRAGGDQGKGTDTVNTDNTRCSGASPWGAARAHAAWHTWPAPPSWGQAPRSHSCWCSSPVLRPRQRALNARPTVGRAGAGQLGAGSLELGPDSGPLTPDTIPPTPRKKNTLRWGLAILDQQYGTGPCVHLTARHSGTQKSSAKTCKEGLESSNSRGAPQLTLLSWNRAFRAASSSTNSSFTSASKVR